MKPRFRCSYSSLWRSQNSRFRRACSVRSDKRVAQTRPASPNQSSTSRCADSGESDPCTRLFGIASARSPRIVPGAAVAGIRRAHRRPDDRDRRLALEHERKRRRGGDELDELAEERLLAVLGVVLVRELAVDLDELRGAQGQAAALEARQDLAGERALDGVRLDQDECPLDGHGAPSLVGRYGSCAALGAAARAPPCGRARAPQACPSASRSTGTPARAPRAARGSCGTPASASSCRPGRRGSSARPRSRQTGQRRSRRASRSSIALISSSRSRTSSRYSGGPEEHVDQRPDERRDEPEDRRHRHQPGILDPAARVLADPVGGRQPEDDDEEDAAGSA